jgi:transposase
MLKEQLHFNRIWLVTGRTDLRNGISGLSALVRLKFGKNPLEDGTLFLFCGNDRKTVKGLVWDDTGYVLITKKLSYGRFQWPRNSAEAKSLTQDEFNRLMDGFSIVSTIPKRNNVA